MSHPIGMISGESPEVYHAAPDLSHSKLEDFRFREAYYYRRHVSKVCPPEHTKALSLGSAIHSLALEGPAALEARFAVIPENAPRRPSVAQLKAKEPSKETTSAIKWWDDFKASSVGKDVLTKDEFSQLKQYCDAICANQLALELMTAAGVANEVTFRTPPLRGLPIGAQCKADGYNPVGCERSAGCSYAFDLKSCNDLSAWLRQYYDLGYYRQGAFYRRVIETVAGVVGDGVGCKPIERFFFIVFEKNEPFGCTVFEADGFSLGEGLIEVENTLARIRACYEAGVFPAAEERASAGMPTWYKPNARRTAA